MEDTQLYNLNISSKVHNYSLKFEPFQESLLNNAFDGDVIIVDSVIFKLNKGFFKTLKINVCIIKVNSTEKSKSYRDIEKIISKIVDYNFKKNNKIIAIGGGVIQDICGFISSILHRGSRWIFYPTTLLAQGDSCIGGKSSINLKGHKNQLGGFYPPFEIIIDILFLETLPKIEIISGLGEICHYFLIKGGPDFETFKNKWSDKNNLKDIIFKSLLIKKSVIELDEFDKKERQVFNYGHSFGHAIESITNYSVPHGIAVALGMDIANYVSYKSNYISYELFSDLSVFLENFWINNEVTPVIFGLFEKKDYILSEFINILKKDKKNVSHKFALILSKGIGDVFKTEIDSEEFISKCIDDYFKLKLCQKTHGNHPLQNHSLN